MIRRTEMIKGCLHNLSLNENNNKQPTMAQLEYYKGMLLGLTCALMDCYHITYDQAQDILKPLLPNDHITIPL